MCLRDKNNFKQGLCRSKVYGNSNKKLREGKYDSTILNDTVPPANRL